MPTTYKRFKDHKDLERLKDGLKDGEICIVGLDQVYKKFGSRWTHLGYLHGNNEVRTK